MKLGALKSAIKAHKGNPWLTASTPVGQITFVLQQTPLLAELDRLFPDGRAQKTGLRLTNAGQLEWET